MIPSIEEIRTFLEKLGFGKGEVNELVEQIEYFETEAPERDDIVRDYLRDECIERLVEEIVREVLKLGRKDVRILDVAAGSGFFTERVKRKLEEKGIKVEVYGFDITPSMLKRLKEKGITPIWGVAEKIRESIEIANEHYGLNVPEKFDVVVSTLAFHHFLNPEAVLGSMKDVLAGGGKAVIIDVLKHRHGEFRETLKDTHLGFSTEEIREMGLRVFKNVEARPLGLHCEVDGVLIGLYKAVFS
ncbi:class I SAM-dependent methyltransferase [Thermococcus thioreducens]|uniref:Methyltransferase n=1 Tax=Thermococcus thioreducens TaxID=277988 RepID=A0A0Q2M364_9EURY|nr:methyltransferase domain-containing protein [Thermococcus thioreducens]ASJ12647.1 methyltransferase [Thermococcus thioreducens]KQH82362.1 methyltransferase [Thermococcus thioreducens]SEV87311.1 Methyltransferase domain-containing protein [Thermococcus thioreducens]